MHDVLALNGRDALVCRVWASLPLASLSAASAGRREVHYWLDQRAGPIEFRMDQCGLFAARGRVGRFSARLALDRTAPLALSVIRHGKRTLYEG